ncbi:hypothetical protein SAMN05216466_1432 [Paraburkholderia phenazinium]|jgi:hypothetical protein|uniref:Uncharacterized protein n=1 Tax=Paraburkholderia phenazinium TaxID=60549 RepID=A0A1G8P8Y1_9BURK|nr:hypothetical protein [Paraburkholderia phenazinium]SDI88944.1 hypothetical protein SAMN05216466_1432 [Paraburkholderia phenazinium]
MFDSEWLSVKFSGASIAPGVDAATAASVVQPMLRNTNNLTRNHCLTRESSVASRSRCAGLLSNIKYTQAPASHLFRSPRMSRCGERCADSVFWSNAK